MPITNYYKLVSTHYRFRHQGNLGYQQAMSPYKNHNLNGRNCCVKPITKIALLDLLLVACSEGLTAIYVR